MDTQSKLVTLLTARLNELHRELHQLRAEREELDAKEKRLSEDAQALQQALRVETRDQSGHMEKQGSNGSHLLGLKLGEAVRELRKLHPNITKETCRQKLEEIGFDFHGKRPGSAVHMAWLGLERRR